METANLRFSPAEVNLMHSALMLDQRVFFLWSWVQYLTVDVH